MKTYHIYLGLDIFKSESLSRLQRQICTHFCLHPREELHLTLGYVGEVSADQVCALGQHLGRVSLQIPRVLPITGLGGAEMKNEEVVPIRQYVEAALGPRVLWWSVEPSEILHEWRKVFVELCHLVGIDTTLIQGAFYPHITVGSFRPESTRKWDTHQIPKNSTINWEENSDWPEGKVYKLHLTDSMIAPGSVYLIGLPH